MSDSRRIVLYDLNPQTCRNGQCRLLSAWTAAMPDRPRFSILTSLEASLGAPPDLLIVRPSPDESFAGTCATFRRYWPETPLLAVFCGHWTGISDAIACLNDGIDDFDCCPLNRVELLARLQRLRPARAASVLAQNLPEQSPLPDFLVGRSPRFLHAIERLPRLAMSDATILLLGETGTGKEVFARALHYLGARKGHPFIPVNCGSLPDHLLENELFGHVKGAFTDAGSTETGLLSAAEGGTLFLDEVDALSMSAQVKLLRFLQDREYRALGSAKTLVANVRVIAATNADLNERVRARQFREDLYYRVNVLSLRVPPMRERIEDVSLLANHFLRRFRPQSQPTAVRFSPAALQKLGAYHWPGNVRELEATIQRAVVLGRNPTINAADIDLPIETPDSNAHILGLHEAKRMAVGQFEKTYLINLLSNHGGNISQAAREAGKERRSFQRLVRKHQLDRDLFKK